MYLLNRYIMKYVVMATLVVSLIFVGINFFIDFAAELSNIGQGQYNLWHAFIYVAMQLPFNFYQLFPMAGLLGALIGLGQLSASNELIVMRAAGFSVLQVSGAVIYAAIFMLIIAMGVGELLAPGLLQYSEDYKNELIGQLAPSHGASEDIWMHDNNRFIHIEKILDPNTLQGITEYKFNDSNQLSMVSHANYATRNGFSWLLQQTTQLQFNGTNITGTEAPYMTLMADIKPKLLNQQDIEPEELSLRALYETIRYRTTIGLSSSHIAYIFWQRIISPFTVMVMMCLGVPFIFGSQRSMTMGQRIVIGVVLGFGFYMLNQFLGLFSMVFQLQPFVSAAFPTLLFGVGCLWMLRYVR